MQLQRVFIRQKHLDKFSQAPGCFVEHLWWVFEAGLQPRVRLVDRVQKPPRKTVVQSNRSKRVERSQLVSHNLPAALAKAPDTNGRGRSPRSAVIAQDPRYTKYTYYYFNLIPPASNLFDPELRSTWNAVLPVSKAPFQPPIDRGPPHVQHVLSHGIIWRCGMICCKNLDSASLIGDLNDVRAHRLQCLDMCMCSRKCYYSFSTQTQETIVLSSMAAGLNERRKHLTCNLLTPS